MSAISTEGPPEAKKFRIDLPTQVVVEPSLCSSQPSPGVAAPLQGEAPQEGQSPAGPSSARSSNGSEVSSGSVDKEDDVEPGMTGSLLEMISKSLLGNVFKLDDLTRPPRMPSAVSSSPATPAPTAIPGALAVAQSPAAQLFSEDDWSWHRNPAAAIRSGGTNKQTPVWKYFVYNKAENLSRCIIGDCTYSLKGPHTSTLACHLKKHPLEYAEFQKLKVEYTRERHGGQLPPSPSSSASGASATSCPSVPPLRQQKIKKEPKPDVSNLISALRASGGGSTTHSVPNMMHNLLGINPLQFMLNPTVPTSSSGINAVAANQMLQQAGLTVSANGQIVQSKKWRRDERRQRELESRLAIAFASSHISLDALHNPLWKELMECAQPKFTLPEDKQYFEQLVSSTHLRLLQSLKSLLSSARRVSLLVDGIRLPPPSGSEEPITRLCICAAFPAFSNQNYEVQIVLLGLRPLVNADNISEAVSSTIDQVMVDFDLPPEKITRIVCAGLKQLLGDDDGCVVDKQMESFSQRVLSCFTQFLETNVEVDNLKKAVYALIFAFVTRPDALQALNKATGGAVDLPLTEPFPVLVEAVLKIRPAIESISIEGRMLCVFREEQWSILRGISNAAALFQEHANASMGAECATIDGVVPSIKQLLLSLEKDTIGLGSLSSELKDIVVSNLASIMDISAEDFDGIYIQATSLNPQLAVLLNEDQIAYARRAIEQQLVERLPPSTGTTRLPLGVDALLANVLNGRTSPDQLPSIPLYGDLLQQAHERLLQEHGSQHPVRDRITEAAVSSYFDEILSGTSVEALLSPFAVRSFGNPFQAPLLFWHGCSGKCPSLSELALELLAIPAATVHSSRVLSQREPQSIFHSLDPLPILSHLDRPERLERDLLLRFNNRILPKSY